MKLVHSSKNKDVFKVISNHLGLKPLEHPFLSVTLLARNLLAL